MVAEALNCPNCGAAVMSDRSSCEFCKVRLKTVACTSCVGLMFVGAKFCGHCGAIAAPVDVLPDEKTGECPRCKSKMDMMSVGDLSFRSCSRCDGVWIGVETFETICADHERQAAVLGHLADRDTLKNPYTKINYVPCPDCGDLMNRNNFARASGIIVDICKKHGIWFDADELPAIVEFIRKGGMDLARQREKLELESERERLRHESRRTALQDRRIGIGRSLNDPDNTGIRGFVRSLFE